MLNSNTLFNSESISEVLVGKILRPWGIKGCIKVLSLSDNEKRFSPGNNIYIEQKKYTITSVKRSKENFLITLDSIKNVNQADSLRDKLIKVHIEDISPLEPGNYYHFQLLGLHVFTEEYKYLGDVIDIINTGANDINIISLDNIPCGSLYSYFSVTNIANESLSALKLLIKLNISPTFNV